MVPPALTSLRLPLPLALLIPVIALGAVLAGCDRKIGADPVAEANRLKTELEATRQKLSAAEKLVEAKNDALTLATEAAAAAKTQLVEKDQLATEKDAQLRALQTELETLKKRDAFVFAEISALRQQGLGIVALSQYQKFLADFPQSPLVPHATTAVAELTAERNRDSLKWAEKADPKRKEHAVLKHFGDGFTTLAELAPLVKKKSFAQVVALLGRPDQTFSDGTEIGYADKAFDPAANRKGMLIISFEAGTVSTLRIGYAGRKMTP